MRDGQAALQRPVAAQHPAIACTGACRTQGPRQGWGLNWSRSIPGSWTARPRKGALSMQGLQEGRGLRMCSRAMGSGEAAVARACRTLCKEAYAKQRGWDPRRHWTAGWPLPQGQLGRLNPS